MLELTFYILVFLGLSGLMAAVEAAVLTVSRGEVEELLLQRAWGADALKIVTGRITQAVVVMVVFTNTINVLGPILAGRKAQQLFGDAALGAIVAVLTFGTIVFSEIIPKSLGSHYAPIIGRWAAPVIRLLVLVLYPLVVPLEWFSNLLKSGKRRIGTEAQIRALARIGRRRGYIESNEGQLVQRAFLLNDKSAMDIMTPLKDVVAVGETDTVREAAAGVFLHAYSRYPVFGGSTDEIVGLVMTRDILKALVDGRGQDPVSTLCLDILTVPSETRSDELLVLFRDEHIHLAVVRDKHETVGLVTLEDVLEELVGEIDDEKDVPA